MSPTSLFSNMFDHLAVASTSMRMGALFNLTSIRPTSGTARPELGPSSMGLSLARLTVGRAGLLPSADLNG